MPADTMPFPSRALAEQELTHDTCYGRIPEGDRAAIVERAWSKGVQAAKDVFSRFDGETELVQIVAASGLVCRRVDKDYVAGDRRYFSDYSANENCIHLYLGSIRLWAQENGMTEEAAQNVILSHEYFHFLERTRLGLTSRDYQVPILALGPLRLGRTGVRALSEIGAHGFARTYYELTKE